MEPRDESDEGLMRQVALGRPEAAAPGAARCQSAADLHPADRGAPGPGGKPFPGGVFGGLGLAPPLSLSTPFRPWLFGIALNKCRADMRRQTYAPARLDDCPADCPAASDPAPGEAAAASETAALVADAVGRLPPAQRAVVTMRVWNGLSYHEIAEAVGRSEATVRSHMFHGLAAIRRHLEPRMK